MMPSSSDYDDFDPEHDLGFYPIPGVEIGLVYHYMLRALDNRNLKRVTTDDRDELEIAGETLDFYCDLLEDTMNARKN